MKKLRLTKEWRPDLQRNRLYLFYGSQLIASYEESELSKAQNDFDKFNPEMIDITICEKEV